MTIWPTPYDGTLMVWANPSTTP